MGTKRDGLSLKDRILKHVHIVTNNSCWEWKAKITRDGYGHLRHEGMDYSAHRASYLAYKGTIPSGYEIDHLCRNKSCANPSHLEAVTPWENTYRARKTHCKRGHELVVPNIYAKELTRGVRVCRLCKHIRMKNRR